MSIDMAQFHQVFFEESFEGLEIMETGLMDLEPGVPDNEVINSIFRAAHSIKGGSGTFGFKAIADFTHVMETLLDEMRDNKRDVTTENADILLRSVDCLKEMLEAAQDGDDADENRVKEHQDELEKELANSGDSSQPAASEQSPSVAEQPEQSAAAASKGWKISFKPASNMFQTANDPLPLMRELRELGDLQMETHLGSVPDFDQLEAEDCYISWTMTLITDAAKEQINEVFAWVEDLCKLEITPLVTEEVVVSSQPETTTTNLPVPQRREEDQGKPKVDRRKNDRRGGASGGAAATT